MTKTLYLEKNNYDGLNAHVIQHEHDHLKKIIFVTDHLKPIKRRLMKRKLEAIKKGKVEVDYRMKFAEMKKSVKKANSESEFIKTRFITFLLTKLKCSL